MSLSLAYLPLRHLHGLRPSCVGRVYVPKTVCVHVLFLCCIGAVVTVPTTAAILLCVGSRIKSFDVPIIVSKASIRRYIVPKASIHRFMVWKAFSHPSVGIPFLLGSYQSKRFDVPNVDIVHIDLLFRLSAPNRISY